MTTKSLIYKVANFHNGISGETLQSLLAKAVKVKKSAFSRRIKLPSSDSYALINYNSTFKTMFVGEFFDYTVGDTKPLAKLDTEADTLELSSLAPPDDGSEFLHGILYFAVSKNSVIISQSASLRANYFESYLNQFIRDANIWGADSFLTLADHPPFGAKAKVSGAKRIELSAPLPFKGNTNEVDSSIHSYSLEGGVWDAIKEFFPSEFKWPRSVPADEILSGSQLNVKLVVSWARNKGDDSTEFLDRISNQLRHVDDELDYVIRTRSGTITKDDFKLKISISLSTDSEGMISRNDMWQKMHEWLTALISQERIIHQ